MYSSLNKIEILDNVGLYKEADAALRKIISQEFAHNKYKNIKTADVNHWTKFTNFNEVRDNLIWRQRQAGYEALEKNREYSCGELETIVNGEKIKISVWFDISEDGAFFSINDGKIVIGDVWYIDRYLAHELNHAYEDILEVKKAGEITRPFKNFYQLSQDTWSKETIDQARKHLFPGKRSKKIIEMLDASFDKTKDKIKQKMFKNEKNTDTPEYWEKIIDKKLPQDLRQSIINDLKKMTLGFREYYRLPEEVRSRLAEILYSLSKRPLTRDELLRAKPKKFEEYFKDVLGENYLLLAPEQKQYILNNVYQSLRGGKQQTITNNIINSTQDGIKRGLLPKNIGQMYPVQIKQLINENPEIKQFISVMRGNSGISDSELIETIQKAANNQIQTQTTTDSGEHSYNDILRQRQENPDLEEEPEMVEQSDSQSELTHEKNEKNIKIAQIKDLIQNPLKIQQSLQNLNLIDRRMDQIISFLYNSKTTNTLDVAYLRSIFPKNQTTAQQRMNKLNNSLRALQKTQALGVSGGAGEAGQAAGAAKATGQAGIKPGVGGAAKATGQTTVFWPSPAVSKLTPFEIEWLNSVENKGYLKDFDGIKHILSKNPGIERETFEILKKSGKVNPQLLSQSEIYLSQLGKASGTVGEVAGVTGAAGEAGQAAGAAKATGQAAGEAGQVAGAAKAATQAEGVMGKALANPTFQKILGAFQKAAPAMRWLPPVAVAIELATKALTKPEELDGFDFGKLISGMMLIPPIAASIAAIPVIGVALVSLAGVGAFGGLDVARFATDPKKGLDLMGMNVAIKDQDYDKAIDQAIQVALARIHAKQSLIKTAHNLSTRSDKIVFLSYLLTKLAEKNMIEANIKTATSNSRIKIAQTNENFFEKAGIDSYAYTGTADQNERLRKAINPSSPDFASAFEKKFGTWIKTPSERITYLSGNTGSQSTGQINTDFYELLSSNSQIQSSSLAGIASSIKRNVDAVAKVDFTKLKFSPIDEKSLQTWVQSQVRGAEQYKTESTTTFSGLGIGESRKNEVLMITESMAKIAQIKEKFKQIISGGGQNAQQPMQQPVQQRTSSEIFKK